MTNISQFPVRLDSKAIRSNGGVGGTGVGLGGTGVGVGGTGVGVGVGTGVGLGVGVGAISSNAATTVLLLSRLTPH